MQAASRYVFDNVEIRPRDRRLVIKGRAVPLGSRAFDVLMALVTHRDRVVPKAELIKTAWPNLVVEPNNLVVQVGTLRKLLGAAAITTIPGRGYKFSATAVSITEALEPQASTAAASPPHARLKPSAREPMRAPWSAGSSRLIGRSADVQMISEIMLRHRVVTITGPTGIGKTRVAQRLVDDTSQRFGDGGAWIDLTSVPDALHVIDVIAGALNLNLSGSDSLVGLLDALRPLNMLLAVDNVEQIVDEVARVVQAIVNAAPGVAVLLTSQSPLRISEEKVVRLKPMAVPYRLAPASHAMQFDAVAFFVERARSLDSTFTLDAKNVSSIIDICHRLDGNPLAIDLAASRLALLGIGELARSIDNQLSLLASPRKDLPYRHRTLRRALEWSYILLSSRERILLRRLAVFASSFSLELALAVLASPTEGFDEWDVLDALTELIDRSLVIVDIAEPPRYRLLQPTKAFALEQLALADEVDIYRRRHAQATCKMVSRMFSQRLHDWDRSQSLLTAELPNAHEALAWALDHDPLSAVQLVPPISCCTHGSSSMANLHLWTASEKVMSDSLPLAARAQWAIGAGLFVLQPWQHRRKTWARTALELWPQLDAHEAQQIALMVIERLTTLDSDAEHQQLFDKIQELDFPDAAPAIRTLKARQEARAALARGEPERAILALEDAYCSAVAWRNGVVQDVVLIEIANAEHAANRLDDAIRHGKELIERFRGKRKTLFLSSALCNLVAACLESHDYVQAKQRLIELRPLAQAHGFAKYCCQYLALLCAVEGNLEEAARLLGTADILDPGIPSAGAESKRRIAERAEKMIVQQLDAATFSQLRAHGRLMPKGQALTLGCGEATFNPLVVPLS